MPAKAFGGRTSLDSHAGLRITVEARHGADRNIQQQRRHFLIGDSIERMGSSEGCESTVCFGNSRNDSYDLRASLIRYYRPLQGKNVLARGGFVFAVSREF